MRHKTHTILRVLSWLLVNSLLLEQASLAFEMQVQPIRMDMAMKPSFTLPSSVAFIEDSYKAPDASLRAQRSPPAGRAGNLIGQIASSSLDKLGTPRNDGPTEKTIYLIQDPHTNESGQLNIARALDTILEKEKIKYVFLEAGTGNDSLSFLRSEAGLDTRRRVGLSFLKNGELSGDEYLDLTSERDFVLWGVEQKDLYWKSLNLYKEIAAKRDFFLDYLKKIELAIKTLKPKVFNLSLLNFDNKHESYLKGELSVSDYYEILSSEAQKREIRMESFPYIRALRTLRKKEAAIDFQAANEEQLKAIQFLGTADQAELLELAKEHRHPSKFSAQDQKEEKAFYTLLEEILQKQTNPSVGAQFIAPKNEITSNDQGAINRAPTSSINDMYPNLSKYFDYLKEARTLDMRRLLVEQGKIEDEIYARLIHTTDETNLHQVDKNLRVLQDLMSLILTPDQFDAYRRESRSFDITAITGFLNKKIMDLNDHYDRVTFLEKDYAEFVKKAEQFYELTYQRDVKFIENAVAKMDQENQTKAVLVAGGYHSPNLRALLKEKGISFICITPQVLHETNRKRYEKILFSQKPQDTRAAQVPNASADSDTLGELPAVETLVVARLADEFRRFKQPITASPERAKPAYHLPAGRQVWMKGIRQALVEARERKIPVAVVYWASSRQGDEVLGAAHSETVSGQVQSLAGANVVIRKHNNDLTIIPIDKIDSVTSAGARMAMNRRGFLISGGVVVVASVLAALPSPSPLRVFAATPTLRTVFQIHGYQSPGGQTSYILRDHDVLSATRFNALPPSSQNPLYSFSVNPNDRWARKYASADLANPDFVEHRPGEAGYLQVLLALQTQVNTVRAFHRGIPTNTQENADLGEAALQIERAISEVGVLQIFPDQNPSQDALFEFLPGSESTHVTPQIIEEQDELGNGRIRQVVYVSDNRRLVSTTTYAYYPPGQASGRKLKQSSTVLEIQPSTQIPNFEYRVDHANRTFETIKFTNGIAEYRFGQVRPGSEEADFIMGYTMVLERGDITVVQAEGGVPSLLSSSPSQFGYRDALRGFQKAAGNVLSHIPLQDQERRGQVQPFLDNIQPYRRAEETINYTYSGSAELNGQLETKTRTTRYFDAQGNEIKTLTEATDYDANASGSSGTITISETPEPEAARVYTTDAYIPYSEGKIISSFTSINLVQGGTGNRARSEITLLKYNSDGSVTERLFTDRTINGRLVPAFILIQPIPQQEEALPDRVTSYKAVRTLKSPGGEPFEDSHAVPAKSFSGETHYNFFGPSGELVRELIILFGESNGVKGSERYGARLAEEPIISRRQFGMGFAAALLFGLGTQNPLKATAATSVRDTFNIPINTATGEGLHIIREQVVNSEGILEDNIKSILQQASAENTEFAFDLRTFKIRQYDTATGRLIRELVSGQPNYAVGEGILLGFQGNVSIVRSVYPNQSQEAADLDFALEKINTAKTIAVQSAFTVQEANEPGIDRRIDQNGRDLVTTLTATGQPSRTLDLKTLTVGIDYNPVTQTFRQIKPGQIGYEAAITAIRQEARQVLNSQLGAFADQNVVNVGYVLARMDLAPQEGETLEASFDVAAQSVHIVRPTEENIITVRSGTSTLFTFDLISLEAIFYNTETGETVVLSPGLSQSLNFNYANILEGLKTQVSGVLENLVAEQNPALKQAIANLGSLLGDHIDRALTFNPEAIFTVDDNNIRVSRESSPSDILKILESGQQTFEFDFRTFIAKERVDSEPELVERKPSHSGYANVMNDIEARLNSVRQDLVDNHPGETQSIVNAQFVLARIRQVQQPPTNFQENFDITDIFRTPPPIQATHITKQDAIIKIGYGTGPGNLRLRYVLDFSGEQPSITVFDENGAPIGTPHTPSQDPAKQADYITALNGLEAEVNGALSYFASLFFVFPEKQSGETGSKQAILNFYHLLDLIQVAKNTQPPANSDVSNKNWKGYSSVVQPSASSLSGARLSLASTTPVINITPEALSAEGLARFALKIFEARQSRDLEKPFAVQFTEQFLALFQIKETRSPDQKTITKIELVLSGQEEPLAEVENPKEALETLNRQISEGKRDKISASDLVTMLKASDLTANVSLDTTSAIKTNVNQAHGVPLSLIAHLEEIDFKAQLDYLVGQAIATHLDLKNRRRNFQFFFYEKESLTKNWQKSAVTVIEQKLENHPAFLQANQLENFKGIIVKFIDAESLTATPANDGREIFLSVGKVETHSLAGWSRLFLLGHGIGSVFSQKFDSHSLTGEIKFEEINQENLKEGILSFYEKNLEEKTPGFNAGILLRLLTGQATPKELRDFRLRLPLAVRIPIDKIIQGARLSLISAGVAA